MGDPRKLVVCSLKGGTGKTTICLSIAKALRDTGHKVGLFDIDIHASALPRALHLERDPGYEPLRGGKLRPIKYDGFEIFSVGLLFKDTQANMWDGHQKSEAVRQFTQTSIAWSPDLEWIVVDTPPTSGDEIQSLLGDGEDIPPNLTNIYGAVVICQPNDLAVLALAKTLDVLRETLTPVCGVIANMAGYICPNCGHLSNPFDREPEDVKKLTQGIGIRFLGAIPFGPEETRRPVVEQIVEMIVVNKPVLLKKQTGGAKQWWLKKILELGV